MMKETFTKEEVVEMLKQMQMKTAECQGFIVGTVCWRTDMTDRQLTEYLEKIDEIIEKGKYKADWQSLSKYPVPQWYREAKFGIFIHCGIYSVPAYFSEWYCRMMYYKGNPTYWHHKRKRAVRLRSISVTPQRIIALPVRQALCMLLHCDQTENRNLK